MALAAGIAFALSLAGIAVLFLLKHREVQAGEAFMPETLRDAGDVHALAFKEFLGQCRTEAALWPPRFVRASRFVLRDAALSVAVLARFVERQSHALADRVSHKHRFERRESANTFLKQVGEVKHDEHPLE